MASTAIGTGVNLAAGKVTINANFAALDTLVAANGAIASAALLGGSIGYQTGVYYDGSLDANSNTTFTTGATAWNGCVFVPRETRTFDRAGLVVTTAATGGSTCRVVMVTCSTAGALSTVITDFGTLAIDAATGVEFTGLSVALTLGVPVAFFVQASATVTFRARNGAQAPQMGYTTLNDTAPAASWTLSSASLPASFATATRSTNSGISVRLRAA